jgi:hypothetical protein
MNSLATIREKKRKSTAATLAQLALEFLPLEQAAEAGGIYTGLNPDVSIFR